MKTINLFPLPKHSIQEKNSEAVEVDEAVPSDPL